MFKLVILLGLVGLLNINGAKGDWVLVWEDNFDHGEPIGWRWNFEDTCQGGKAFTSGRIWGKDSWTYGKFEMRARLPKGKHLWPAFWMMPTYSNYGDWPRSGEIDIMEYRGQRPNNLLGTLHFGGSREAHGQVGSPEIGYPFDFSQDFHVFAVDWSPQKIMWMVDGQVFHEETLQRNFQEGFYNAWGQPFDKAFHMILNLAVGGSFFGDEPFDPIEADGWQKPTFEIDWIRKWEWQ